MAIARPVSHTIIATPTWGFPVTDEVNRLTSEGTANVAKLASLQAALNSFLNPTWTAIPLASPFVPFASGYATPAYSVQGSWVALRGMARQNQAADITAAVTLATMPVEARPLTILSVLVIMLTGSSAGVAPGKRMQISTGGVLTLYPTTTETLSQNAWISLDGIKYNMIAST